jgi:general secretion pathway protein F
VLVRLADYLESQVRTRNRVSGILIYPIIVLIFAVIVVIVLVTYVLPKVTELLAQTDQELPLATSVILRGSELFTSYWWLLALLGAAAFVAVRSIGRTERGRYALDGFKLRLPIFGRLLRTLAISRFSRTLTTLLSGGIPIVRALETAGRVAGNAVIAEAVTRAKDSITEGSTIAAPLRASGQFPPLVTHMVSVGERSGELEAMLAKVADAYDEQVEITLSRLTAVLQPLLMIILVGIVAFIIVATLLPLLNLAGSLQQV